MRTLGRIVVAVLAVVGALAALVGLLTIRGGFGARARASGLERGAAEVLRDLATPRSAKRDRSPFAGTPDVLVRGRRHFASECAPCHGNDGKGADLGKRMFPPVPSVREDLGDLTDGQIFHVVANGIRWSGMAAFVDPANPDDVREHWEVVYFVRHLPDLGPGEIEEMKRWNPRSEPEAAPGAAPAHEHERGHTHEHAH